MAGSYSVKLQPIHSVTGSQILLSTLYTILFRIDIDYDADLSSLSSGDRFGVYINSSVLNSMAFFNGEGVTQNYVSTEVNTLGTNSKGTWTAYIKVPVMENQIDITMTPYVNKELVSANEVLGNEYTTSLKATDYCTTANEIESFNVNIDAITDADSSENVVAHLSWVHNFDNNSKDIWDRVIGYNIFCEESWLGEITVPKFVDSNARSFDYELPGLTLRNHMKRIFETTNVTTETIKFSIVMLKANIFKLEKKTVYATVTYDRPIEITDIYISNQLQQSPDSLKYTNPMTFTMLADEGGKFWDDNGDMITELILKCTCNGEIASKKVVTYTYYGALSAQLDIFRVGKSVEVEDSEILNDPSTPYTFGYSYPTTVNRTAFEYNTKTKNPSSESLDNDSLPAKNTTRYVAFEVTVYDKYGNKHTRRSQAIKIERRPIIRYFHINDKQVGDQPYNLEEGFNVNLYPTDDGVSDLSTSSLSWGIDRVTLAEWLGLNIDTSGKTFKELLQAYAKNFWKNVLETYERTRNILSPVWFELHLVVKSDCGILFDGTNFTLSNENPRQLTYTGSDKYTYIPHFDFDTGEYDKDFLDWLLSADHQHHIDVDKDEFMFFNQYTTDAQKTKMRSIIKSIIIKSNDVKIFNNYTEYTRNQIISYNDNFYKCNVSKAYGNFNPSDWVQLSGFLPTDTQIDNNINILKCLFRQIVDLGYMTFRLVQYEYSPSVYGQTYPVHWACPQCGYEFVVAKVDTTGTLYVYEGNHDSSYYKSVSSIDASYNVGKGFNVLRSLRRGFSCPGGCGYKPKDSEWNLIPSWVRDLLGTDGIPLPYIFGHKKWKVDNYSTSSIYHIGDYVCNTTDSKIYRCIEDGATGTWDSTKWSVATYDGNIRYNNSKLSLLDLFDYNNRFDKILTRLFYKGSNDSALSFQKLRLLTSKMFNGEYNGDSIKEILNSSNSTESCTDCSTNPGIQSFKSLFGTTGSYINEYRDYYKATCSKCGHTLYLDVLVRNGQKFHCPYCGLDYISSKIKNSDGSSIADCNLLSDVWRNSSSTVTDTDFINFYHKLGYLDLDIMSHYCPTGRITINEPSDTSGNRLIKISELDKPLNISYTYEKALGTLSGFSVTIGYIEPDISGDDIWATYINRGATETIDSTELPSTQRCTFDISTSGVVSNFTIGGSSVSHTLENIIVSNGNNSIDVSFSVGLAGLKTAIESSLDDNEVINMYVEVRAFYNVPSTIIGGQSQKVYGKARYYNKNDDSNFNYYYTNYGKIEEVIGFSKLVSVEDIAAGRPCVEMLYPNPQSTNIYNVTPEIDKVEDAYKGNYHWWGDKNTVMVTTADVDSTSNEAEFKITKLKLFDSIDGYFADENPDGNLVYNGNIVSKITEYGNQSFAEYNPIYKSALYDNKAYGNINGWRVTNESSDYYTNPIHSKYVGPGLYKIYFESFPNSFRYDIENNENNRVIKILDANGNVINEYRIDIVIHSTEPYSATVSLYKDNVFVRSLTASNEYIVNNNIGVFVNNNINSDMYSLNRVNGITFSINVVMRTTDKFKISVFDSNMQLLNSQLVDRHSNRVQTVTSDYEVIDLSETTFPTVTYSNNDSVYSVGINLELTNTLLSDKYVYVKFESQGSLEYPDSSLMFTNTRDNLGFATYDIEKIKLTKLSGKSLGYNAQEFKTSSSYSVGTYVTHNSALYKTIRRKPSGYVWIDSYFEKVSITDLFNDNNVNNSYLKIFNSLDLTQNDEDCTYNDRVNNVYKALVDSSKGITKQGEVYTGLDVKLNYRSSSWLDLSLFSEWKLGYSSSGATYLYNNANSIRPKRYRVFKFRYGGTNDTSNLIQPSIIDGKVVFAGEVIKGILQTMLKSMGHDRFKSYVQNMSTSGDAGDRWIIETETTSYLNHAIYKDITENSIVWNTKATYSLIGGVDARTDDTGSRMYAWYYCVCPYEGDSFGNQLDKDSNYMSAYVKLSNSRLTANDTITINSPLELRVFGISNINIDMDYIYQNGEYDTRSITRGKPSKIMRIKDELISWDSVTKNNIHIVSDDGVSPDNIVDLLGQNRDNEHDNGTYIYGTYIDSTAISSWGLVTNEKLPLTTPIHNIQPYTTDQPSSYIYDFNYEYRNKNKLHFIINKSNTMSGESCVFEVAKYNKSYRSKLNSNNGIVSISDVKLSSDLTYLVSHCIVSKDANGQLLGKSYDKDAMYSNGVLTYGYYPESTRCAENGTVFKELQPICTGEMVKHYGDGTIVGSAGTIGEDRNYRFNMTLKCVGMQIGNQTILQKDTMHKVQDPSGSTYYLNYLLEPMGYIIESEYWIIIRNLSDTSSSYTISDSEVPGIQINVNGTVFDNSNYGKHTISNATIIHNKELLGRYRFKCNDCDYESPFEYTVCPVCGSKSISCVTNSKYKDFMRNGYVTYNISEDVALPLLGEHDLYEIRICPKLLVKKCMRREAIMAMPTNGSSYIYKYADRDNVADFNTLNKNSKPEYWWNFMSHSATPAVSSSARTQMNNAIKSYKTSYLNSHPNVTSDVFDNDLVFNDAKVISDLSAIANKYSVSSNSNYYIADDGMLIFNANPSGYDWHNFRNGTYLYENVSFISTDDDLAHNKGSYDRYNEYIYPYDSTIIPSLGYNGIHWYDGVDVSDYDYYFTISDKDGKYIDVSDSGDPTKRIDNILGTTGPIVSPNNPYHINIRLNPNVFTDNIMNSRVGLKYVAQGNSRFDDKPDATYEYKYTSPFHIRFYDKETHSATVNKNIMSDKRNMTISNSMYCPHCDRVYRVVNSVITNPIDYFYSKDYNPIKYTDADKVLYNKDDIINVDTVNSTLRDDSELIKDEIADTFRYRNKVINDSQVVSLTCIECNSNLLPMTQTQLDRLDNNGVYWTVRAVESFTGFYGMHLPMWNAQYRSKYIEAPKYIGMYNNLYNTVNKVNGIINSTSVSGVPTDYDITVPKQTLDADDYKDHTITTSGQNPNIISKTVDTAVSQFIEE